MAEMKEEKECLGRSRANTDMRGPPDNSARERSGAGRWRHASIRHFPPFGEFGDGDFATAIAWIARTCLPNTVRGHCAVARSMAVLQRHYNGSGMAAGDAQRVWFQEMVEQLRSQWHLGMSFDAIVELRDDLDATLQRVRSERQIRSPLLKCARCGHVGEGAEPHVSVRAMILSLNRFGIAPAEQAYALEKDWAAYRKDNELDLYGKRMASPTTQVASCVHA